NQVNDGEMIYKLAQAYSELKRPKEALEMFNLSIDKGFFCYPYFKTDPLLDNIRKDKDFDNILQKAQKRHNEFKNKFLNDNQSLSSMKKVENSI
ncbi:MAG TPA: hypothetical protein PKY82_14815, partial [Pyrinomonadaceae bacterium]|nr:hypothetical protein [Pyrinomonadaceae bacterium]